MRGKPCPDCGSTRKFDHKGFIPTAERRQCGRCDGSGSVLETRYDYLPKDILEAIPLLLVRQDRGATFNESLLGLSCLWSSIDYGRAWGTPEDQFCAKIRLEIGKHGSQACHVVDDKDRLPPAIGVFVHREGYSVRAMTEDSLRNMARERSYEEGMAVGMMVYRLGGHGTLAGVYRPELEQEGG
jgi:ribosomal protein S27AE